MGRYYTKFTHLYFGYEYTEAELLQNALFGATAMLAGYSRMTYSLIVIMLETTNSINLYTPMLICMLFSYCTALIFNKSLYNTALKGKQIPMLLENIPPENKNLKARVIMAENPVTLSLVPTVKEILTAL
jgi:H+/Cl- antiporter ClcA